MRRLGLFAALLALAACDSTGAPPAAVVLHPGSGELTIVGAVEYVDVEGGGYLLRDADGTRYNPQNLPETYRIDGLAVRAEVDVLDDYVSFLPGVVVEIRQIEPR